MSKYQELRLNPPIIEVKKLKGKKEVIFTMVSCMCDNIAYIKLKKNQDGEFRLSSFITTYAYAFSNFQTVKTQHEIEWAADAGNWSDVICMINSGTSRISEFISR